MERRPHTYAPLVSTRHTLEAGGEHLHEARWIILTTLDGWEEGTTFVPCLVRGPLHGDPHYEHDTDAMKAISGIFRDGVRRLLIATRLEESVEEPV